MTILICMVTILFHAAIFKCKLGFADECTIETIFLFSLHPQYFYACLHCITTSTTPILLLCSIACRKRQQACYTRALPYMGK